MTPNELVLTFEGLHFRVKFGDNRQKNATVRVSTHGQTDTQTDGQTDANRFYYLSHAICYSYEADNYATFQKVFAEFEVSDFQGLFMYFMVFY